MREKKKILKFRKFKVASLNPKFLVGGARADEPTTPLVPTHVLNGCPDSQGDTCTRTHPKSDIHNPCGIGDTNDDTSNNGYQTGPDCP